MATSDLIVEEFVTFPTGGGESDKADDEQCSKTTVVIFLFFSCGVELEHDFFTNEGKDNAREDVGNFIIAWVAEDIPILIEIKIYAEDHGKDGKDEGDENHLVAKLETDELEETWEKWQDDGD